MIANGLNRYRTAMGRLSFREIRIAQTEDDLARGHLLIRWPGAARFAAMSSYLTALIEEILDPGARCEITHEFEFRPEAVEFLLTLLVQNELDQRSVITEIAHHVVIA